MLRTSGEILIGNPTGYNSGSSVQRPITRKMIRRSILSIRSEKLIAVTKPLLFSSAQIRAFDAENNFERERDGAEADADQNGPADRGVEHIENPLGDIAAHWKQILTEWYAAHHDDHRCHQQHGGLAASCPERPVGRRGDEECQDGEHRALQRYHHEAIDPTEPRHGAVETLVA